MNIKDLIGLKIIDIAQTVEGDEWTITLEGKKRLVISLTGEQDLDEPTKPRTWCKGGHHFECTYCLDEPKLYVDIQDYSGPLGGSMNTPNKETKLVPKLNWHSIMAKRLKSMKERNERISLLRRDL